MKEHWYNELGYFCKDEMGTLKKRIGRKGTIGISYSNMAGNCNLCLETEGNDGKNKMMQKFVREAVHELYNSERTTKLLEANIKAKGNGKFVVFDDGGYTMQLFFDEADRLCAKYGLQTHKTYQGYHTITICGKESKQEVYDWLTSDNIDFIIVKEGY